jgi:hypothetical protein
MASGILLKPADAADIATPATGKVTVFLDQATGEPAFKDDTATVTPLRGATGATGATGDPGADGQGVPVGGTAGQVLTKQSGTDFDADWETPSGGGGSGALVLLESHTASASSSLDFTTRNAAGQSGATFQSDYDQYIIELINIIPTTNAVQLLMRMSVSAAFDATAGNYSWDDMRIGPGGAAAGGSASAQTSLNITGSGNVENLKNTAAEGGLNGHFRLFNPLSTTAHKTILGNTAFQSGNNSTYVVGVVGGKYINTAAIDGIRFLHNSGTIASGTIRVYGVAK